MLFVMDEFNYVLSQFNNGSLIWMFYHKIVSLEIQKFIIKLWKSFFKS